MSDYISIKDDRFWQILFDEACVEGKQAERIQKELEQIALDEKEIIRKPFERVVERLEEQAKANMKLGCELQTKEFHEGALIRFSKKNAFIEAIEIVKEECGINE